MLSPAKLAPYTASCRNESQILFVSRAKEQLSRLSNMTQRPRYLNGRLALKELHSVADACAYHNVNPANFSDMMGEFGWYVGKDPILKACVPYVAQLLALVTQTFNNAGKEKKTAAIEALLPAIRRAMSECDSQYLSLLRAELINNLRDTGDKAKQSVYDLCGYLISDCVGRGFSVYSIAQTFNEHFSSPHTFFTQLYRFCRSISADPSPMQVTFMMSSGTPLDINKVSSVVKDVTFETGHITEVQGDDLFMDLFDPQSWKVVYASVNVKARASFEGIAEAKRVLAQELDLLKLSSPYLQLTPLTTSAIVRKDGQTTEVFLSDNEQLGFKRGTEQLRRIHALASAVLRTLKVQNPRDHDRLASSIRYFRLGFSEELTQEVRFLNSWIALEYLMRVQGYESEIASIKDLLPRVLGLEFYQFRLESLYDDLVKIGITLPPANRTGKAATMLSVLLSDANRSTLETSASTLPLALIRIQDTYSLVASSAKAEKAWQEHIQRLEWHVQRMYRTRNAIVHSGARDQNLVLLTTNLQEYLELILLTLIRSITSEDSWSIDQTFRFLRMQHEYLRSVIKDDGNKALSNKVCSPYKF